MTDLATNVLYYGDNLDIPRNLTEALASFDEVPHETASLNGMDGSRTITVVFVASDAAALSYAQSVGRSLLESIVLRN